MSKDKNYEQVVRQWEKDTGETMCPSLYSAIQGFIESEREKYLKGFIKLGYGKRCKEYEEGCPTCDEWKLYDEYIK